MRRYFEWFPEDVSESTTLLFRPMFSRVEQVIKALIRDPVDKLGEIKSCKMPSKYGMEHIIQLLDEEEAVSKATESVTERRDFITESIK